MTNDFALNHDKILQIYFFCVKRRAKNGFLKDVESTVVNYFSVIGQNKQINFMNTKSLYHTCPTHEQ